MATLRTDLAGSTYKLLSATCTRDRFAQIVGGAFYGELTNAGVIQPALANQHCDGVFMETNTFNNNVGVYDVEGQSYAVDGDGTVVVGDLVTNDALGRATPIAATGTPTFYNCLGKCVWQETDFGQRCIIKFFRKTIYM